MAHHNYDPPGMPEFDFTDLLAQASEPRTFRAAYDGECAACLNEIWQGDDIGYNADNEICCEDCLRKEAGL